MINGNTVCVYMWIDHPCIIFSKLLEESRVKLWHFAILISSLNLIHERMQPRPNPVCFFFFFFFFFGGGGGILTVRNFDSWLPFCRLVCIGCICIYHNPISKCYRCNMGTKFFLVRKKTMKKKMCRVPPPPKPFQGWRGITACIQLYNTSLEENKSCIRHCVCVCVCVCVCTRC